MHPIATLRSLFAAPRRGVVTALMIAVVIAGIVSMHSMSGPPSAPASPVGMVVAHGASPGTMLPAHGISAQAMATQVTPTQVTRAQATPAPPVTSTTHVDAADCHTGCGSHGAHDMAAAMCLMVLVVLLTLAAPPSSVLNAVLLPLARRAHVAAPHSRPAAAPSLHALGISRT